MFDAETTALIQEDRLCGEVYEAKGLICVGVKGHEEGYHSWRDLAPAPEIEQ